MSVFPCNPRQPHQVEEMEVVDFNSLVVYMDNTLLRSVAKELFNRCELELKSSSFPLTPALRELLNTFMRESRNGMPGSALMQESIALQVAITLLRESRHNLSDSPFRSADYSDDASIKKAVAYLTENYQNNLSLSEIAKEVHYSSYHFLRLFKRHTGVTPFEYLLNLRIEKAKDLLKKTNCSISQICDICAFGSLIYFSRIFKEKTGVSPTEYKKQI